MTKKIIIEIEFKNTIEDRVNLKMLRQYFQNSLFSTYIKNEAFFRDFISINSRIVEIEKKTKLFLKNRIKEVDEAVNCWAT